jgi:hypothetical protein
MPDKDVQSANMTAAEDAVNPKDRGGRRCLADRRQFSSSEHFPERRNLRHRRSGTDRRNMLHQKMRKRIERRRIFNDKYA